MKNLIFILALIPAFLSAQIHGDTINIPDIEIGKSKTISVFDSCKNEQTQTTAWLTIRPNYYLAEIPDVIYDGKNWPIKTFLVKEAEIENGTVSYPKIRSSKIDCKNCRKILFFDCDKPANGLIKEHHPNGNLKSETSFADGLLKHEFTYDESGQLQMKTFDENSNFKKMKVELYEAGKLKETKIIRNKRNKQVTRVYNQSGKCQGRYVWKKKIRN